MHTKNSTYAFPFSKLWKALRPSIAPFQGYILGLTLTEALWSFNISLRPYFFKKVIDALAGPHDTLWIRAKVWVALYAAISLGMWFIKRIYDFLYLHCIPPLKEKLELFLMSQAMEHSHRFYQDNLAGSISDKIKDVTVGVANALMLVIDKFFSHGLAVIVAMVTSYSVSPIFGMIMALWVCILSCSILWIGPRIRLSNQKASESVSILMGQIVDLISNMNLVRFSARRGQELTRFAGYTHTAAVQEQKVEWAFLWFFGAQGLLFTLVNIFCVFLLLQGYQQGSISIGDFTLITTLNWSIMELWWSVSADITKFTRVYGNIVQGVGLLLSPKEVQDAEGAKVLLPTKGPITFDAITFAYPGGIPVFENFSLSIQEGMRLGIAGYSGSGKSTLISLLLRLFEVQKGRILISGLSTKAITQDSLRQTIGYIPQDIPLFHRSLAENMQYGCEGVSQEALEEAAKQLDLHDFIVSLPEGYETQVGERGVKLSGGQKQRIAMVRMLLKNSPIMILDEATSSLDSLSEKVIQNRLITLMQNRTTIVIAHRLSTLLSMDAIAVLDKGRLVQYGSHETLLSHKDGLYWRLWNAQVQGFLGDNTEKPIMQ